jgi:hypothetical protein
MKNLQTFLLLLISITVTAQYHEHKAINVLTSIQPLKLNGSQQAINHVAGTNTNITLKKTEINNDVAVPTGAGTMVPSYSGNHRLQSYQTFDVRGNLVDSRASFNLKAKKRK